MSVRTKVDFDGLMRHLTVVGFAALTAWTVVSTTGLALGVVRISPHATLRFLLAVLVVVFSRRTYWEMQEWRWRHLPPDERYGFASPIWEHPRLSELDKAPTPLEEVEEPRR
jgi:steroid 5-alpha reductase family enzyme